MRMTGREGAILETFPKQIGFILAEAPKSVNLYIIVYGVVVYNLV